MLPVIFRLSRKSEKGGIPEIASDEIKGYECNCHYFLIHHFACLVLHAKHE
jgi:hypothetical protein